MHHRITRSHAQLRTLPHPRAQTTRSNAFVDKDDAASITTGLVAANKRGGVGAGRGESGVGILIFTAVITVSDTLHVAGLFTARSVSLSHAAASVSITSSGVVSGSADSELSVRARFEAARPGMYSIPTTHNNEAKHMESIFKKPWDYLVGGLSGSQSQVTQAVGSSPCQDIIVGTCMMFWLKRGFTMR